MGAPKKCSALLGAAAIAGGASLLSGLIGSGVQAGFTKAQQKLQSRLNREEMAYSQGLQQNNQEWLMNRQYGATVSGMKNAGLNPATANGTTPATPALAHPSTGSSGGTAGMPSFDPMGAALNYSQLENLDAQTERTKIDNKKNELEYQRMKEEYDYGNREERVVKDPETGAVIASSDDSDFQDKLDAWDKQHPGKTPSLNVVKHSYGREQMRQQESEWKTQSVERDMRRASALLDTAIKSGQLEDKDVMDAFVQLPANEKKTLLKIWREYDDNHDIVQAQKDFLELQKQDFAATSFGSLIANLKDENLGVFEKFMATLGFVANKVMNNTSFSFGFTPGRKPNKGGDINVYNNPKK